MKRNSFVSSVSTVTPPQEPRNAAMTPAAESATQRPRVEGDREQEILDATLVVLGEVGYDRLTMDAVATKAKASMSVCATISGAVRRVRRNHCANTSPMTRFATPGPRP